jgi:hypothetical protein
LPEEPFETNITFWQRIFFDKTDSPSQNTVIMDQEDNTPPKQLPAALRKLLADGSGGRSTTVANVVPPGGPTLSRTRAAAWHQRPATKYVTNGNSSQVRLLQL